MLRLRSLTKEKVEIASRKLTVSVGGVISITRPAASKMGTANRFWTIDTKFPNYTGVGDWEEMETWSTKGGEHVGVHHLLLGWRVREYRVRGRMEELMVEQWR